MAVVGAVLAGLCAGVLSGWGVGGGSLLLVYLTAFAGLEQATAQGINLLYFLPCAALALWGHGKKGLIDGRVWLPAAVGGCAMAVLGALLAGWLPAALLRRGFGLLVLAMGIRELTRK